MPAKPSSPEIPLPRGWPSRVKSAILHVISLGQFTLAYTRGWAANSPNARIRLKAEVNRACQEITLLREEIRQPPFEPRADWPRRSPCAKPVTLVKTVVARKSAVQPGSLRPPIMPTRAMSPEAMPMRLMTRLRSGQALSGDFTFAPRRPQTPCRLTVRDL